jgi:hypothetical protein
VRSLGLALFLSGLSGLSLVLFGLLGRGLSALNSAGACAFALCQTGSRKCHHRESNPAPPSPESYAVTKYRA